MKPNIIFLTIDSLRSDKILDKNKSSITPNIDKLISSGTCFNQTISTADQTGLCLGSVFTSFYPFKSGISYFNFDHNIPNFFNLMKSEGYELNCFVPDLSFFKNIAKHFDKNEYYVYDERSKWLQLIGYGKDITEKINHMTNPWFYFIHLMDLRPPYSIPSPFNNKEITLDKYRVMNTGGGIKIMNQGIEQNASVAANARVNITNTSGVTNELLIARKPIITTGESWFTGLGVFYEPNTWGQLKHMIDNVITDEIPDDQVYNRLKLANWWRKHQSLHNEKSSLLSNCIKEFKEKT